MQRFDEAALRSFGAVIQKVVSGMDLTREESYAAFREILLDEQPDLQQGAFLAALATKRETAGEIAGAWAAIRELDTVSAKIEFGSPLVENSGTGMDQLKTFNVSTAAAVIAAAGGVRLARHGSRALTSACGTVDIAEALGVDVECDMSTVERSISEVGIGLFNGMSSKVHPRSLARILSRIRFGSTLNIAASLASPCRPTHALRGVHSESMVEKTARVMREIGYQRTMTVHGFDNRRENGMDELSNIGQTLVHESLSDGNDRTYRLEPEDLGLNRYEYNDIAATGKLDAESLRFLKVIAGTGPRPCMELACLNAGAILYLSEEVRDMQQGVETCLGIVARGQALKKLCEWVYVQSDPAKKGVMRLLRLASSAGLEKEVRQFL